MSKMKQNKSYYQDILSKLIEFKKVQRRAEMRLSNFF